MFLYSLNCAYDTNCISLILFFCMKGSSSGEKSKADSDPDVCIIGDDKQGKSIFFLNDTSEMELVTML